MATPLRIDSMGMTTHRIVCDGTIAFDLASFAEQRPAAQANVEAAFAEARELAARR